MGPEGPRGFGPFHLKPKAHVDEEEVPGDEWRESRLPECTAEDDLVLGRPKSWEKKVPLCSRTSTRGSQKRFQAIWASHRGIGGEAAPGKAVTSVLNTTNTLIPFDVDVTPGQGDGGYNSSQSAGKNGWGDVH